MAPVDPARCALGAGAGAGQAGGGAMAPAPAIPPAKPSKDGASMGADWDTSSARIVGRAPLAGTYTVLVASNTGGR